MNSAGEAFVAGQNTSTNFPTAGAVTGCSGTFTTTSFQCNQPAGDAFVTKMNAAGSALVWSTYLGGSKEDQAWRIALDSDDNPYVIGTTVSADDPGTTAVEAGFPTTLNAYDSTCGTDGYCNAPLPTAASCPPASFPAGCPTIGTSDTFLTKLNSSGSSLLYSSYLGGSDQDHDGQQTALPGHMGIAVSGAKAYLTSNTGSTDFPVTAGAFQSSCSSCAAGGLDAYVSVIDTDQVGSASLTYSTYLGGSGDDQAKSIAVDKAGNAYVAGTTMPLGGSDTFPTTLGALLGTYQGGASDAFVAKINPTLVGPASLIYSTFLGGGGKDEGWGIAVNGGGMAGQAQAFVTGFTDSGDDPATGAADGPTPYFPTTAGAFDTTFNGRATDAGGDTTFLNGDAYVTKLNPFGNLAWSTFLGGTDHDLGGAIAVDSDGQAYVTGYTTCENTNGGVPLPPGDPPPPPCSGSFPTVNPVQANMDGNFIGFELHNSPTDIFVAKLAEPGDALVYSTYLGGNDFDRGFSIAVRDRDANGDPITPEAYVTGRIASTNYPVTAGAFQTTKPAGKGNRDAAISKITG
ncbi:MAG: SBBP repeat-containing protein [Actinomycetota bacterium]